ncbi:MAG: acetolactate synthase small subunit [bacterium]
MTEYTILTKVLNKPGVLNKIASLMRRKMYNINTLTVCQSVTPGISKMTITLFSDSPEEIKQVLKQLEKIPEVITAVNLDPEKSFWREVAIIKCSLLASKINSLRHKFDLQILREKKNAIILQVSGTSNAIDEFIGSIGMKNILDISRSGVTALEEDKLQNILDEEAQINAEKITTSF